MKLSDLKNIVEQTLHFNFPSRVQGDAFTKEVKRISGAKAEHDDFGYVRVQNSGSQENKIRQAAAKHGGHSSVSESKMGPPKPPTYYPGYLPPAFPFPWGEGPPPGDYYGPFEGPEWVDKDGNPLGPELISPYYPPSQTPIDDRYTPGWVNPIPYDESPWLAPTLPPR